jgi:hypothetical protein
MLASMLLLWRPVHLSCNPDFISHGKAAQSKARANADTGINITRVLTWSCVDGSTQWGASISDVVLKRLRGGNTPE